ncbi:MAG: hypothetical protein KDK70_02935 [Myxococcales bacterium]|nr:hypothetical protein [Myxococcales bacterium]
MQDEIIYVISMEEAQRLGIVESPNSSASESSGGEASPSGGASPSGPETAWKKWNSIPHSGAAYYSTGSDVVLAGKLAKDFGTMAGRVYFRNYGGKLHIVLKGRPGLREILTGTKYGVNNAKVVSLGLGPVGVRATLQKGGVISIVLLTAYNIIDFVLRDDATLMDLLGQIGSDVIKVGIATGVSIAAATAVGTAGLIASFALGPLVVAILVGVGTAMVLDAVDNRYQLTQRMKDYLNKAAEAAAQKVQAAQDQARQAVQDTKRQVEQGLIDLTLDLVQSAGEYALRSLGRYLQKKLDPLTWLDVY